MSRIEVIEDQIKALSAEELASLRDWFLEYDSVLWDHQLESDVASGKLDDLAQRALRDYDAGRSTKL